MSNLMKFAVPVLKPLAKQLFHKVKKETIKSGKNVVHDVIARKIHPKTALKRRGRETISNVISGYTQSGKGRGKTRKKVKCSQAIALSSIKGGVKRKKPQKSKGSKRVRTNTADIFS